MQSNENNQQSSTAAWLKRYYFLRFGVSTIWVILAFTIARNAPTLAAIMLVSYPVWDAVANFLDARRNGGLIRNKSQMLNFIVSILTAIAIAIALGQSMNAVLTVFGVWAIFSGVFQLITAVRRWKFVGAQWAMILSGGQSALAGAAFVFMATGQRIISIADIAPYAAFGALYFFISAVWLTVRDGRRSKVSV